MALFSAPGPVQPPMKSVAVSAPTVKACRNSPTKNMPNFMPEYSMLKPATISDSASSRSNGARPVSATEVMKKMKAATGALNRNQTWFCACEMAFMLMLEASNTGTRIARIMGTS